MVFQYKVVKQAGLYTHHHARSLVFFEKLFWKVRECYPQDDSRAMSFFGRLFEKYLQDIIKNSTHKAKIDYIPEFKFGKDNAKSSDAYIRIGKNLIVVEMKGFSAYIDVMINNKKVDENISKLFVKPICQADKALERILNETPIFNDITKVYYISVTMENIGAVPWYIDTAYQEILKAINNDFDKKFFNMNVEEFEMLMTIMERGENICELLDNYFNSTELSPFKNYLYQQFEGRISMTEFMTEIYREASNNMKKLYFEE